MTIAAGRRRDLTAQQEAVIASVIAQSVTVVAAGAGSGKTSTTVAAVLALLEGGASIDEFALITFTNKAADELRERIGGALERAATRAVDDSSQRGWRKQQARLSAAYVGTIHGFCGQILRTYGFDEWVAHTSETTLSPRLLREELARVIETVVASGSSVLFTDGLAWDAHTVRERVKGILEGIRRRGLTAADVLAETRRQDEDAGKEYRVALAELVADVDEAYTDRKIREQIFDSDDQLQRTAALLGGANGQDVIARIAARRRYLFVDEFQDTDRLQKQIIDRLCGRVARVMVVGDRKQSIYAFRGAEMTLLEQLAEEQGVAILPLQVSWRPTVPLLRLQNALFGAMRDRYPRLDEPMEAGEGVPLPTSGLPPLVLMGTDPAKGRDGQITAAENLIRRLLTGQIDDPRTGTLRAITPGDIAILVRTNEQLYDYAAELARRLAETAMVRAEAGGRLFERPEIVATYRMLRLVQTGRDDIALAMALRTPYLRAVDATVREQQILQYGVARGGALSDWLALEGAETAEAIEELRRLVPTDTVPQLLARLYERFAILDYYRGRGDLQAVENLERLRELARGLVNEEQALTLQQLVRYLAVQIRRGADEEEALLESGDDVATGRPNYVRVITIHRSKGLEFPIVLIPGVDEPAKSTRPPDYLITPGWGLEAEMPVDGVETRSRRFREYWRAQQDDLLAERFRLFYVAVTRAQHQVILIGERGRWMLGPSDKNYSWQDEVLRARVTLEESGAVIYSRQT